MITKTSLRALIKESHRRQFAGEDYQAVAHDLANRPSVKLDPDTEEGAEAWHDLESEPAPDCECGFCATADFRVFY
jgi:hypothetical protein